MTALAASLLLVLLNRPEPLVIERVVRVPVEVRRSVAEAADAPEQADRFVVDAARNERAEYQPPSGDSYLRLRNRALALGIDSWMDAVRSPGFASEERPASYRELRDSLLQ
jgi:hypothetical protein